MTPNENCQTYGHHASWCTTPTSCAAPSVVRENALRDPSYRPYCLRCRGLVRMRKVENMHWRCDVCGATHKEE